MAFSKNVVARAGPLMCPICRAEQFMRVLVTRSDGTPRTLRGWECCGCSVMFTDFEKFIREGAPRRSKPLR